MENNNKFRWFRRRSVNARATFTDESGTGITGVKKYNYYYLFERQIWPLFQRLNPPHFYSGKKGVTTFYPDGRKPISSKDSQRFQWTAEEWGFLPDRSNQDQTENTEKSSS
jgi:hypothetical protein